MEMEIVIGLLNIIAIRIVCMCVKCNVTSCVFIHNCMMMYDDVFTTEYIIYRDIL